MAAQAKSILLSCSTPCSMRVGATNKTQELTAAPLSIAIQSSTALISNASSLKTIQSRRRRATALCPTASCHARLSVNAAVSVGESELDLVSRFSEIVPDTIVGDDFERFAPTAATVTSSLILGISSLPEAKYDAAIESALAYDKCLLDSGKGQLMSCFLDKALVNVGAELAKVVPGRVSTEVDPRLARDAESIVEKVRFLLRLYSEVGLDRSRILFKIPATWQGIEAARQLEDDGIQTHITGVSSFAQAAACAQAAVSVIQIPVGRIRDWARANSGDADISRAVQQGEDPGVTTVRRAVGFIRKNNLKTKVMASNIRTKDDVLALLGVDYIIAPLKVLESLQKSPAATAMQPKAVLGGEGDAPSIHEVGIWDEAKFSAALGAAGKQLLDADLESAVGQTRRVEEYFAKIWPPPNV